MLQADFRICIAEGIAYSAVKYQMKLHGKNLKEGDVLMTNSPHAGGSYVVLPPVLYGVVKAWQTSTRHHINYAGVRSEH